MFLPLAIGFTLLAHSKSHRHEHRDVTARGKKSHRLSIPKSGECVLTEYGYDGSKNADGTRYGGNRIAGDKGIPAGTEIVISYKNRRRLFTKHDTGGAVHGSHFDLPPPRVRGADWPGLEPLGPCQRAVHYPKG